MHRQWVDRTDILKATRNPASVSRQTGLRRASCRWALPILIGLLGVLSANVTLAIDPVYSNWRGLAIHGTDPVAYFTEGEPVEGSSEFSLEYMDATWRFASAKNRALFEADPSKFAPQYGGYCAWAVSQGYTASIDPNAWSIVDGKLYLNYNDSVMQQWLADRDNLVREADRRWPGIRDE